jgi:lipopolysaccharide heptosyltransferase II
VFWESLKGDLILRSYYQKELHYKIVNKKKRMAVTIADLFGYAMWRFLKVSDREIPSSQRVKEILIIRTAYIGDVIMTLPILKPLKEMYKDAKITFLTGSRGKEVLEKNSFIDEILTYDAFWFYPKGFREAGKDYWTFLIKILRSKSYDLVIEARGDIRDIALLAYLSRAKYRISYNIGGGGYLLTHIVPFKEIKHKVEYHLDIVRFLGCEVNQVDWLIYLTPEEKNYAKNKLLEKGIEETDLVVGIHPGGRLDLKCWSSQKFAEVADWIIERYGAKVVFTGAEKEKGLIENIMKRMENPTVNLSGKIDLRLLSGLIERFNLFICNDSAPLHIASAMKTPTVAIFGPSKSRETGPYGNLHRVVEKDFPCRYTCDENSCHHERFHACMKDITVEDVFEAVKAVLEGLAESKTYIYKAVNERGAELARN